MAARRAPCVDGAASEPGAPPPEVGYNSVSPGFFETLGIPLRRGRLFDARDTADAPLVVIVNEALVARFFPGQDPIGRRLRTGPDQDAVEIVGVVGDVRRAALDSAPPPEMFEVASQGVTPSPAFVVRAEPSAFAALPQAVRGALRAVDPDLPAYAVQAMPAVLDRMIAPRRLLLVLLASFGSAALLLAGLGVFGVASQQVAQSRREITVRMALGAHGPDVVRMVVSRGLTPVAFGLVAGTLAAGAAARGLGAMLFGVTPADLLTHAGALAVLAATATLACLLPARRAVAVAPSEVLRGD